MRVPRWHKSCNKSKNMGNMAYRGYCRDVGAVAAGIQQRFWAQLNGRCDPAGQAGRHRPSGSDSLFRSRPNYTVLSLVLAALFFAVSSAAQARTINAASPSLADVTTAVNASSDGDTVVIPSGTASWTSNITLTKAITIIGQTTTNIANGTAPMTRLFLLITLAESRGDRGISRMKTILRARRTKWCFR
jgi:hypothetical protein